MKLINEPLLEITIDFLKELRESNGICLVGLIEDLENIMQSPSFSDEKRPAPRRRRLSDEIDDQSG
ncbi:MAG: hypothetical protein ACXWFX_14130 [Methylobacter sp.]